MNDPSATDPADPPADDAATSTAGTPPAPDAPPSSEGGASGDLPGDVDPEAPFGRRKDGSPAAKRGRKPKGEAERERLLSVGAAPPRPAPAPVPVSMPAPSAIAVNYRALGRTYASLWFSVGELVFGGEWAPNPPDPKVPGDRGEAELIAHTFEEWARAKNQTALDPTVALVVTLGSYALGRLTRPTIRQRITGAYEWVKEKGARLIRLKR